MSATKDWPESSEQKGRCEMEGREGLKMKTGQDECNQRFARESQGEHQARVDRKSFPGLRLNYTGNNWRTRLEQQ